MYQSPTSTIKPVKVRFINKMRLLEKIINKIRYGAIDLSF
jgi:hypothetical protein